MLKELKIHKGDDNTTEKEIEKTEKESKTHTKGKPESMTRNPFKIARDIVKTIGYCILIIIIAHKHLSFGVGKT